ncbi:hypothetical protein FBALC1_12432 [Flavobacteriales bacterium ALC-1]|nr:hypothetical protein FBALC1_12432 [Flavobacteriales bacterium ALC-1]
MIKRVIILVVLISLYNCEELIEVEDISNEVVTILAPSDNSTIDTNTINFSWQALEFAETYQLQIARSGFETPEEIVEDTLVSVTSYTKVLLEGNYQWRIKAINFGYETPYTTQNLTIED